jgi:hypothetical protein
MQLLSDILFSNRYIGCRHSLTRWPPKKGVNGNSYLEKDDVLDELGDY